MPQPRQFKKLSRAMRREIAEQQVEQLERELFNHQLNRARQTALGLTADVATTDAQIAALSTALDTTEAEAAKLVNGGAQ